MSAGAPAPGVAHRAAEAELWLRDADGRGLRTVTLAQAHELAAAGAAYPDIGPDGRWRHVRLKVALPPNSRRTLLVNPAASGGGQGARYEHNHRACRLWPH